MNPWLLFVIVVLLFGVGAGVYAYWRGVRAAAPVMVGALLLAILVLLASLPARAERPPELAAEASYSTRAGAAVEVDVLERTRVPFLALVAVGNVALLHLGDAGAELPRVPASGAPPSLAGAGAAFVYGWSRPFFRGYVTAQVDAGAADVAWVGHVGARVRADLDYALLVGGARLYAAPGAPSTWDFALHVRPYVHFVEVLLACDSRDGAGDGTQRPCGIGAALRFRLPSTPVGLSVGARVPFFDLAGNVGPAGLNVTALVEIDR
jgi:hypothetical protein